MRDCAPFPMFKFHSCKDRSIAILSLSGPIDTIYLLAWPWIRHACSSQVPRFYLSESAMQRCRSSEPAPDTTTALKEPVVKVFQDAISVPNQLAWWVRHPPAAGHWRPWLRKPPRKLFAGYDWLCQVIGGLKAHVKRSQISMQIYTDLWFNTKSFNTIV